MLKDNYKIISILCLISSLGRFVLDSYLPSLPAISDYFKVDDDTTQLTLTVYLLGFSFSQLFYGPLSDRYGRKKVILFGMSIFLLGNLVCSLACCHDILVFCRFVAGMGAGACGVLNRAIASDCFKGSEFSKAWSYTTTALVLTLIIAPVMGGYVQEFYGWRANFVLSTLFVMVVLIIIMKFLPETHLPSSRNYDVKVKTIVKNYLEILSSPAFLLSTLCYTLAFSGLIIYFQVSPVLFINEYGLSASQYGWSSLIIALSYLVGGLAVNRLADVMSMHTLLMIGILLLITGGVIMLIISVFNIHGVQTVLVASAIYVIGARIVIPNAIAGSMEEFKNLKGSCSAVIGFIQMLGSSIMSLAVTIIEYDSPLPIAIFFTLFGITNLILSILMKPRLKLLNCVP